MCAFTQADFAALGQIAEVDVNRGQVHIELSQHFIALPVIIHVTLHLFKITADGSTGIGQDIRNDPHTAFRQLRLNRWVGRAIGTLHQQLHLRVDALQVFRTHLAFDGSRHENIDRLLDPAFVARYSEAIIRLSIRRPPRLS